MRNIDDEKAAVKRGLDLLTDHVFRLQSGQGLWPASVDQLDFGAFFADLHMKVTNAYSESKSDPMLLTWIDPDTGDEVPSGQGIPNGMPVSMAEIIFDLLGLFRMMGYEPGVFLADIGVTYANTEGPEGPDVESVLAEAGEGAPEKNEAETK